MQNSASLSGPGGEEGPSDINMGDSPPYIFPLVINDDDATTGRATL